MNITASIDASTRIKTKNTDLLKYIFNKHVEEMDKNFLGIIFCGSVLVKPDANSRSDIDFIIVLDGISAENLEAMSRVRTDLTDEIGRECSNTILLMSDFKNINLRFRHIDGKAVQAVIQANSTNSIFTNSTLQIPALSSKQIAEFSEHNFYVLRSLLVKTLVRSEIPMADDVKVKTSKIALAACKMVLQSRSPMSIKKKAIKLTKLLESIKRSPQRYDGLQLGEAMLELSSLAV